LAARGDRGENIEKTDLNSNSRLNNLPAKDAYIVRSGRDGWFKNPEIVSNRLPDLRSLREQIPKVPCLRCGEVYRGYEENFICSSVSREGEGELGISEIQREKSG